MQGALSSACAQVRASPDLEVGLGYVGDGPASCRQQPIDLLASSFFRRHPLTPVQMLAGSGDSPGFVTVRGACAPTVQ